MSEGVIVLSGSIQAGRALGQERSWRVDGILEVLHVVRTTIRPPKYLGLPMFRFERRVELHTDRAALLEPELGGDDVSSPALGLVGAPVGLQSRIGLASPTAPAPSPFMSRV